jgi:hypothetical protein
VKGRWYLFTKTTMLSPHLNHQAAPFSAFTKKPRTGSENDFVA